MAILNFFVMGSRCAYYGQRAKGALFFVAQVVFILFMAFFGANNLLLFRTLGATEQHTVWDEALQINRVIRGDNSMIVLIFGVLTIVACIAFIVLYVMNIRMGNKAARMVAAGESPPSFKEDLYTLWHDKYHVVLLTLPTIGLVLFTVIPLIFMILMAFTNFDRMNQPPGRLFTWVGLDNFREITYANPRLSNTFFSILRWTLTWAVIATFSNYIGGMALALFINKKGIRFKAMWRSFFVVTIAVPQFVSLLVLRQLLNDNGTVNVILMNYLGWIDEPIRFWGTHARTTVLLANLWVGIPFTLLITTGILMNIPEELYESAKLDGAGPIMTFRKITLPYMLFITTPYLISQFVGNLNNFNVIWLTTAGQPLTLELYQAGRTDLLITWLYSLAVNEQDFRLAATIGILVFIVVATFSLISFNLLASRKREEEFS
ncbi:MAG: sugar ABC transporter permease [Defluviitaleaceae bacterium]|nr:sugar ABC transporter permease [Defluviitaleaceae bacterium]